MAMAQDNDPELLRGVQDIGLLVNVSARVAKHGLSAMDIQVDAERRLRKAEIGVFRARDMIMTETEVFFRPFLYISVQAVQSERDPDLYALCITVEFKQEASLARRGKLQPVPKVPPFLTTWEQGRVAVFSAQALSGLRVDISELVEQFVADYRSVNPLRR
jgi:hypothetical protein